MTSSFRSSVGKYPTKTYGPERGRLNREYLAQPYRGNNRLIADLLSLNELKAFPQTWRQWWQRIIGRGHENRAAAMNDRVRDQLDERGAAGKHPADNPRASP